MIIYKSDKTEFFKLEPKPSSDGHFIVEACIDNQTISNNRLLVLEADKFLASLEKLEQSRKGAAVLNGSEHFQLKFEPDGGTGALWLSFQIVKHLFIGPSRAAGVKGGRILLEGGFSIDGERVGGLVRDFKELLEGVQSIRPGGKHRWITPQTKVRLFVSIAFSIVPLALIGMYFHEASQKSPWKTGAVIGLAIAASVSLLSGFLRVRK